MKYEHLAQLRREERIKQLRRIRMKAAATALAGVLLALGLLLLTATVELTLYSLFKLIKVIAQRVIASRDHRAMA